MECIVWCDALTLDSKLMLANSYFQFNRIYDYVRSIIEFIKLIRKHNESKCFWLRMNATFCELLPNRTFDISIRTQQITKDALRMRTLNVIFFFFFSCIQGVKLISNCVNVMSIHHRPKDLLKSVGLCIVCVFVYVPVLFAGYHQFYTNEC